MTSITLTSVNCSLHWRNLGKVETEHRSEERLVVPAKNQISPVSVEAGAGLSSQQIRAAQRSDAQRLTRRRVAMDSSGAEPNCCLAPPAPVWRPGPQSLVLESSFESAGWDSARDFGRRTGGSGSQAGRRVPPSSRLGPAIRGALQLTTPASARSAQTGRSRPRARLPDCGPAAMGAPPGPGLFIHCVHQVAGPAAAVCTIFFSPTKFTFFANFVTFSPSGVSFWPSGISSSPTFLTKRAFLLRSVRIGSVHIQVIPTYLHAPPPLPPGQPDLLPPPKKQNQASPPPHPTPPSHVAPVPS